jgi:very-short-patch-repair endonuclease
MRFSKAVDCGVLHPVDKEASAHMRMRQAQNRAKCKDNEAEQWMYQKLKTTGFKWNRQTLWMSRVLDFWCHELGCAVEVDGRDHDKDEDAAKDKYFLVRSGIVTIRVRNFNEEDAEKALNRIAKMRTWGERRDAIGVEHIRAVKAKKRAAIIEAHMSVHGVGDLTRFD